MNIPEFLEFPQPYADVAVTFDNRNSTIRIHYRTLKIMGCPKYFRMMIMKASGDVVLENAEPCEMAASRYPSDSIITVPDAVYTKRRAYELRGDLPFEMFRRRTKWKEYGNYRVHRLCSQVTHHVVLFADKYEILMQGKPVRVIS